MTNALQPVGKGSPDLWSRNARLLLWALVLMGIGAFLLAITSAQAARAWQIYLVNYLYWSGLAATGAVMVAIWRATNSQWGLRMNGVALGTLGFMPVALLAFLPLVAGRTHLFFPWLGHPKPNRATWLEPGFLFTRSFLALLLLYAFSAVYAYFALRPAAGRAWAAGSSERGLRAWMIRGWCGDDAERARADRALRWMTPALLIVYALVLSLVAFDLVMPLDPQMASTLFGGYYFVTALYGGWALVAVLLGLWLTRDPQLREAITADDRHQLGKLIFGFCMLYGMVFWSQYLVMWYGNLLEEIPFLILRQFTAPWQPVSYTMLFVSLLVPFCILLSRPVKKNPGTLAAVGLLILVGMWLERFVLVVPSLWHPPVYDMNFVGSTGAAVLAAGQGAQPSLPVGLLELAVTAGFAAAFLLCYGAFTRVFPVTLGVSARDPHAH